MNTGAIVTIVLFLATGIVNLAGALIIYRQRYEVLERIGALKDHLSDKYVDQNVCNANHAACQRVFDELLRRVARLET